MPPWPVWRGVGGEGGTRASRFGSVANGTCPAPHGRGVTLIELLVTLAVVALAVATAGGIFISQQRGLQAQEGARQMQEAGRRAIAFVEERVRTAGYGVEPDLAWDFASTCVGGAACPRDSVTGPDRLWFYARDPRYPSDASDSGRFWTYRGYDGSSAMQLLARTGDYFIKGQILLLICDGAIADTYVTVGTTTPATGPASSPGQISIPLETQGTPDIWHRQSALVPGGNCFQSGIATSSTLVFAVNRYHFFLQSYSMPGSVGNIQVPWLMFETGRDENLDGTVDANDWLPVADWVEDMQVQYLMNAQGVPQTVSGPPETNVPVDWVFGNNTNGVAETPPTAATAPVYSTAMFDALRFNGNPANIRAVRVDLTLAKQAPAATPGVANAVPAVTGNRTAASLPTATQTPAMIRTQPFAVVPVANMASRSRFRF